VEAVCAAAVVIVAAIWAMPAKALTLLGRSDSLSPPISDEIDMSDAQPSRRTRSFSTW
jgi:hypothetical protein